MAGRSPVHQIVGSLMGALRALGSTAAPLEVEAWGFSVSGALSAASRQFHNHDHVIELARESDGDPLAVLAALYHDSVYIQVDQGPPRAMKAEVESVLGAEAGGWRVLPSAAGPATSDVLAVFDRRVGDVVTPMTGLNELASALVASIHLATALDRHQRIAIAACIEQTVPFRVDPAPGLHARLAALGLGGDTLDLATRRAVRVGNLDVASFAEDDVAKFLDTTWKLLPESNPALQLPTVHTVRDYRVALQKMEGFLGGLPADRVFHQWGGEPRPETYAQYVAHARNNLALSVRYLRAKLYSIAVVEALAESTGGDVPLDYFMGGVAPAHEEPAVRLEHFLPGVVHTDDRDPTVQRLLQEGRASEVSFDMGASPIGAFLHAAVGETAAGEGVALAKRWWAGHLSAREFLGQQPGGPMAAIARAAVNVVDTRGDRLSALAAELEGR
jgi:hypothetical protein